VATGDHRTPDKRGILSDSIDDHLALPRKQPSLISDVPQNSVDYDESVAGRRRTMKFQLNDPKKGMPKSGINITPPKIPTKSIYMITNEFPVQKPYSTSLEW
jgi:hypothetical protein